MCKHTKESKPIAGTTPLLHQCIVKRLSNVVSEDISFRDTLICFFTRQLWQQSLAPGTGLDINITSFMYLSACCFLPPFTPAISFIPPFPLSLFSPPRLHLVTFLKNWQHRREIDVMKNNWDISMSHLLCRYGHPLSTQRGSRLSVAIGGILQISQQLSEVTSQVHRWPHSLPSFTPPGTSSTPKFDPTLFQ